MYLYWLGKETNDFFIPLLLLLALLAFSIYNFAKFSGAHKYGTDVLKWPYYVVVAALLLLWLWLIVVSLNAEYNPLLDIGAQIAWFFQEPGLLRLYWLGESVLPIVQLMAVVSGAYIIKYLRSDI